MLLSHVLQFPFWSSVLHAQLQSQWQNSGIKKTTRDWVDITTSFLITEKKKFQDLFLLRWWPFTELIIGYLAAERAELLLVPFALCTRSNTMSTNNGDSTVVPAVDRRSVSPDEKTIPLLESSFSSLTSSQASEATGLGAYLPEFSYISTVRRGKGLFFSSRWCMLGAGLLMGSTALTDMCVDT